jgi:hypothetical protein
MKQQRKSRHRRSEAGIALLIAIFVLLLVGVVAIALLLASGTETALGANYRSSTNVYYAALAGLEEARGRLLTKNPDYFNNANPGFMPSSGIPLGIGQVRYVTNPVGGENVLTTYPDTEYDAEFGNGSLAAATIQTAPSLSGNNAQGIPGPLFKWVRINAATEKSLSLDVDSDGQPNDNTTPLYYDPAHVDGSGNPQPSLIVNATPPSTAVQTLEITSLAVLPNGSQKLVQYLVAPVPISLPVSPTSLPALTVAGGSPNGILFNAPTSAAFYATGNDLTGIPGCTTVPPVHAIGVFNSTDRATVLSGITSGDAPNYTGAGPAADVFDVSSLFGTFTTPSQFDNLANTVAQSADVIIPSGPVTYPLTTFTGTDLSSATTAMSSSNLMTVVVNGNLDLNAWHHTGYGLLLVIGNLNYDPDASWQGIVMVIGQGSVGGSKGGIGEFDGTFLVAKTRDASGNLLPDPNLGKASVFFNSGMGGNGFRYSSCWTQRAMPTPKFKILSFREIPQ